MNGNRPAQIKTSAWRGEKLMRSMPKREMSNRDAAVAMNSMAQHAVPNGIGHRLFERAQLTKKSSRDVTQFGDTWDTTVVGESVRALLIEPSPFRPLIGRREL